MNDRNLSHGIYADRLDDFLNDLSEDVLRFPDEELRAEIDEDGESLDDYSSLFGRAVRFVAPTRVESLPGSLGLRSVTGVPFSPEALRSFPSVERTSDLGGPTRRNSRPVVTYEGVVPELLELLPEFVPAPCTSGPAMPPNPYRRLVVREPNELWAPMAIGSVSSSYALVQHRETVEMLLRGLERMGLRRDGLRGQLTLSVFGEWMDLRILLPSNGFRFVDREDHETRFRCGVSNSVDSSSSIEVRFDWFRAICANGLVVVREQRTERKAHRPGRRPVLENMERRVRWGLEHALHGAGILAKWQREPVALPTIAHWVDTDLTQRWKLHAAARVFSICASGFDPPLIPRGVRRPASTILGWRYADPWNRVPGSPELAETKYDVAQALSWVASRKVDIGDRVRHQIQIPELLDLLRVA